MKELQILKPHTTMLLTFLLLVAAITSSCSPSGNSLEPDSSPEKSKLTQSVYPDNSTTPVGTNPTETQQEGSEPTSIPDIFTLSYPIVDTGQEICYDDIDETSCPQSDTDHFGQDAQYDGCQPNYIDNRDGAVTDLVTGLMWQQGSGEKVTFVQTVNDAAPFNLAGYTDWRLPSI
jgi:hypothetical protein